MTYSFRTPTGAVDPAKLRHCRKRAERDPKLSDLERSEWLARFDAIEARKEAQFQPMLKAEATGDDVSLDLMGDIGAGFFDEGITAPQVAQAIANRSGTVKIRLNSGGGDAFEASAIANVLSQAPNRVEVDVVGVAASAATLITCAADEVRMGANTLMMVHGSSARVEGDAKRLRSRLQLLEAIDKNAAEMYARKTKKPVADMQTLMAAETWMTATQSVEAGFADSVTATPAVSMQIDADTIPADIARLLADPPKATTVAEKLGLAADATDEAVMVELDRILALRTAPTVIVPVVTAPVVTAPVVTPPVPDPAIAEAAHAANANAAVKQALAACKIAPASVTQALAACDTPAALARMVALWDASPALVATRANPQPLPGPSLTAQQSRLAKQAGLTLEQWLKAEQFARSMESRNHA